MNINDVLLLAKAGFTAEQISKMSAGSEPDPEPAEPKLAPPAEPAPEPVPAPPAPEPAPAPVQPDLTALLKEVKELREAVQAGAIRNPGGDKGPQPQTVEEILASIVEP